MDPGVVTALFLSGLAFNEAAVRCLGAAGYPQLRVSHGFLIQHVVDRPRSIGDLATMMRVMQQAASNGAAELERLGYLERVGRRCGPRIDRVGSPI